MMRLPRGIAVEVTREELGFIVEKYCSPLDQLVGNLADKLVFSTNRRFERVYKVFTH